LIDNIRQMHQPASALPTLRHEKSPESWRSQLLRSPLPAEQSEWPESLCIEHAGVAFSWGVFLMLHREKKGDMFSGSIDAVMMIHR
jgi:hypothetical protein